MIKLNIGSGQDYREGYINVDWTTRIKADVVHDLSKFPWPFPDNYADEILMKDSLEHVKDAHTAICEVHRILKPGGKFVCWVPYAKSDGAFQAIEHHSYYTEKSFDYYVDTSKYPSYQGPEFTDLQVKLDVAHCTRKNRLRNLIPFRMFLRHFLWNMYDEVKFEMLKK